MSNELSSRDKQWRRHLPGGGRMNKVNGLRGGDNPWRIKVHIWLMKWFKDDLVLA